MISSSSRSSSKVYPSLSSTDSTCMTTDMHQSVQPASDLLDLHKQCRNQRTPAVTTCTHEMCLHTQTVMQQPGFTEPPRCHPQSSKQSIWAYAAQYLAWLCQLSNTSNTMSDLYLLRFSDPYVIQRATVLAAVHAYGRAPNTPNTTTRMLVHPVTMHQSRFPQLTPGRHNVLSLGGKCLRALIALQMASTRKPPCIHKRQDYRRFEFRTCN